MLLSRKIVYEMITCEEQTRNTLVSETQVECKRSGRCSKALSLSNLSSLGQVIASATVRVPQAQRWRYFRTGPPKAQVAVSPAETVTEVAGAYKSVTANWSQTYESNAKEHMLVQV